MTEDPEELRVFLASPGDVQAERDCMPAIVEKVNAAAGARTGRRLRLVRWEEDVVPGVGKEAQEVINRQIGDAEVTVVIFWKRLGQPTKTADAATVEEFHRAVSRCRKDKSRQVLTYFKMASLHPGADDLEQALKVQNFRQEIAPYTVYCEFEETDDFEAKVRAHLEAIMRDWVPRAEDGSVAVAEVQDGAQVAFARGVQALEQRDADVATESFERAAAEGHTGAMFRLGMIAKDRDDLDAAADWFFRGADRGDPTAMYNVGIIRKQRGRPEEAEDWFRRGAEGGDVAAMYNLGLLLREQNRIYEAEPWLRAGAEGGDVAAMYNLGALLHALGKRGEAEHWLRRGAEGGDGFAIDDLALLLDERGADEEASAWRERRAELERAAQ